MRNSWVVQTRKAGPVIRSWGARPPRASLDAPSRPAPCGLGFLPTLLACILAMGALMQASAAVLNVVATTSDLGALAREIGGDGIQLTVLARPTEDPHFLDPKPSFVAKLNRADALVEGGAELEQAWLEPLIAGARNPRLAAGARGRIACSAGVALLEIPTTLDRAQGDVHGAGNPHYMTDPESARIVARRLCKAFSALDSAGGAKFQANLDAFLRKLDTELIEWKAALAPFKGKRVVAYHNTWPYFARCFELKIDLFLEPKPGIPPTPGHLAHVIQRMKSESVGVIMVEPFQNRKTAAAVATQTGATVVELTEYPGGLPGTDAGYFALMDHIVRTLAGALGRQPGAASAKP